MSRKIYKHFQGSLDGLCGVYAMINAVNLMFKNINSNELFDWIIHSIDKKHLSRVLTDGISSNKEYIKFVIKPTIKYFLNKNTKINYSSLSECANIDDYWSAIKKHQTNNGSGSVIVGIMGSHHHITCIRKITDKTIFLYDSDGIDSLDKASSKLEIEFDETLLDFNKTHIFIPEETYLFSIE